MIKLNGLTVETGEYPNGETLFKAMPGAQDVNVIDFRYEKDQDLIQLMFVRRHLGDLPTDLRIVYMPYSRMDRSEDGSVFTLKYVCDFINDLDFRSVWVDEPHSDVTMALLDRSAAGYPTIELLPHVLSDIGFLHEHDHLFFPDAGAQKRYAGLLGYKTAVGFKHRDFDTGTLTGEMDVVGFKPRATPNKVLILDDLCSRGGTFVMAAEKLRELGASEVYLLVAHCENTMWEGKALDHLDGLYCTDSILSTNLPHEKVHVYSEGVWQ